MPFSERRYQRLGNQKTTYAPAGLKRLTAEKKLRRERVNHGPSTTINRIVAAGKQLSTIFLVTSQTVAYDCSMPKDMADILRTAITKSGISATQLALRTGVKQQTISEFLRGADMRLGTAQKLADYLGLELRPKRRR